MHEDEMAGFGERAVSIVHDQAWILTSHYEIRSLQTPRALASVGKAIQMAQMIELHKIDRPQGNSKHLPQLKWLHRF